jgi:hypothetical protein
MLACIKTNTFEKNVPLKSHKWTSAQPASFQFYISDTTSAYHLFFTMRHTDHYPFSNIWLRIKTTGPDTNQPTDMKVEVPLAQYDGKWLGRGMNEIWEHKMPLSTEQNPIRFKKQGTYKIELQHIMRTNPLPEVMSVGISLEKISQ